MVSAIVLAAGKGQRMGSSGNKILLKIGGVPILLHSILVVAAVPEVVEIIIAVNKDDKILIEELLHSVKLNKKYQVVLGGSERQDSVYNSLKVISKKTDYVLVHDAARPLVKLENIQNALTAAYQFGAACLAVPVKDTIKKINAENFIEKNIERSTLWAIQTPQIFEVKKIKKAYQILRETKEQVTDDATLMEKIGVKVKLIDGGYQNIKITTPEDLFFAENFLNKESIKKDDCHFRVGMGYDVHRLVKGRKLVLGGVCIPYEYGLEGHSDADVLLHAIKDALLGAAGMGDIGQHFPDTEIQYKGISSLLLLERVYDKIEKVGFRIGNIDTTLVAQKPKLKPFVKQMAENIAKVLFVETKKVNIKATTTEKLGFTGREEGIAAYATILLVNS